MRASMTSIPAFDEAVLDFVAHPVGDLAGRQPQRDVAILVRVVGVAGGQVAHRRLALHVHEVLVVVDVEDRLERFDDAPDDDRGDFDGVAVALVHLQLGALEVAHAQRELAARRQRVDPPESGALDRAFVDAEQRDDRCLVGIDHREPGDTHAVEREDQDARGLDPVETVPAALERGHHPDGARAHEQHDEHHEPTRQAADFFFMCHRCNLDIIMISL